MTGISNQPVMAGAAPQQNNLSDAQFSSYVRKQSISAYESLDAGLTIQTKEGDLVTLSSNTYAALDAHMYNSKGILQTESGTAMVTQNSREITLTSGESFSFSVVGDLSEDELADIEAIVKGIDEIISEMAAGDMDDAVNKALSMGGYDTVSMYAADISYQRSYQMTSEVQAETVKAMPEPEPVPLPEGENSVQTEPVLLPEGENPIQSVNEPFPENGSPHKQKNNSINNINHFVEKMVEKLEKHEDKLIAKAQKPIDKLFRHHLEDVKQTRDNKKNGKNHEKQSIYNVIDNVRKQIDELIAQMKEKMFDDDLSALLE